MTDILKKWAELLLDTGKRNNLVNFRDTKASTLEIVAPDIITLFQKALHSQSFEVFIPKNIFEEDFDTVGKDGKKLKSLSKSEYITTYSPKLKRNHVLVYSDYNPLSAIKNICKKAKSAIDETGVNIAYIAFGFIHWTENDGGEIYQAPILLVPISVSRESSISPYVIEVSNDDVIINPTFAYKLQNEYGIKLPEYDEDKYPDLLNYFEELNSYFSKLYWSISTECKIGIFSFLKINMYKDLKDNAEIIEKNPNVMTLMGIKGSDEKDGASAVGFTGLLEQCNVVDADSSQAEAIRMAKEGKSFVLQGPPGTGKSQTITNIIAECLSDGKKVLFVSEKLAALNVVFNKLKKAGLSEFCLELHSHKANKKEFIDELCHTLRLPKSALSGKAEKELRIKRDSQKLLDDYSNELHEARETIDKSLYEIFEELSSVRNAPDSEYVITDIKSKDGKYVENAEKLLTRYVEYIESIGYDYHNNVWYGFVSNKCSYEKQMNIKADLSDVAELCEGLKLIGVGLSEQYGIFLDSILSAKVFMRFFGLIKDGEFITPAFLDKKTVEILLKKAETMKALKNEILGIRANIDSSFEKEIYRLDGESYGKLLVKKYKRFLTRLFSKEYKRIIEELLLCKKDGKKPSYKRAVAVFEELKTLRQKTREFEELEMQTAEYFAEGYSGITTSFDKLISELNEMLSINNLGVPYGVIPEFTKDEFESEKGVFKEIFSQLKEAFDKYQKADERLITYFDTAIINVEKTSFDSLKEKCDGCYENIDKLGSWCDFWAFLSEAKKLGLALFIDHSIEKNIEKRFILPSYKKSFYRQWADAVIEASPLLTSLIRIPHDEAVKRFCEKDELTFEINKAAIKAKLSLLRPSLDMVAQGSAIAILTHEGGKSRRMKSIRQLLLEITELIQTLKPCFLMSPLSVSTFLSSQTEFDTVVFDEASQIFPEDAIGAIYRGKQLIVVGDSKQMPPSNFFNSVADGYDDEEKEGVTDFESILDICSTAFPQKRLKWHYRSKFEELISFSNKNFYDNELITFPSSKSVSNGTGVEYCYLEGVFDRKTKTNRTEAEHIVDLVFDHIDKYPDRSLGVVAFSISQQELIDRLISKRRQIEPSKEEFFSESRPEPFFVKNLETVQGDERDTIIFSVAYARDDSGRLLLNFGPLNREGGERRLNVAITRARINVQLISCLHYYDIDINRAGSLGARLLREYLDYAENGAMALTRGEENNAFLKNSAEFEAEVFEFLRMQGYSLDDRVGRSSFKISIALREPNSPDYLLAIECDGNDYHSSKTARDRDRLRQKILENMGWKFYRIWSTDWFRNKKTEKERLLKAVNAALCAAPKRKESVDSEKSFEETVKEKPFEFPIYVESDISALEKKLKGNLPKILLAVIKAEAPISAEWLLKRTAYLIGNGKITKAVRITFDEQLGRILGGTVIMKNGFLYLTDTAVPMLRVPDGKSQPRDVKYIATEELSNGIRATVKHNVSCEKAGLIKLLANQLGLTRVSEALTSAMEGAFDYIKDELVIKGDVISLKDD